MSLTTKLVIVCIAVLAVLDSIKSEANLSKDAIPSTEKNEVLRKWMSLDTKLKSSTRSLVKMALPHLMEATENMNISATCLRDMLKVISGVKNLKNWAISFLDASGKVPEALLSGTMASLGSYDECVGIRVVSPSGSVTLSGQHCMVDIRPPLPPKRRTYDLRDQVEELRNFKGSEFLEFLSTKAHVMEYVPFKYGVCIPSGCSTNDLQQVANYVAGSVYLDTKVLRCEKKEENEITLFHVVIISLCSTLSILVVLGTLLEKYAVYKERKFENLVLRTLLCFSASSNWKKLCSTCTSKKEFRCLHGLKALSITWVVMGHVYFYPTYHLQMYQSLFRAQEITAQPFAMTIINSSLVVDTFLFVSGLLVCYLTVEYVKINKKRFNFVGYVLHRFLRITPSYYFIILVSMLVPLMGSGPFFDETMRSYIYPCYQDWWKNFLFVANFFDMTSMCLAHTYYVCLDMQLYLVALLGIFPLIWWNRLGVLLNVGIIVGSMLYTGCMTYFFHVSPTFIVLYPDPQAKDTFFKYHYGNVLSRCRAYFVGILVGYLLATKPELKIPRALQFVGWCASIVSAVCIIYLPCLWFREDYHPTRLELSLYAGCYTLVWALALAWMTICCVVRVGGVVNQILSWKMWVPLGKLTLLIYLIQPTLQTCFMAVFQSPQEFTHFHFIMESFGYLCISTLLAILCNLLVESPFIRLEKLLLGTPERAPLNQGNTQLKKEDSKSTADANV